MADDIDIEEHDILANPRVQSILPVIQGIKSEPVEYDDEMEEYEYSKGENRLQYEDQNEKFEYDYNELSGETDEPVVGNKIILGTKPKPNPEIKFELKVSLEDWGERLENNPCYCKDCKILFATRNAVDAHKMAAHSFLVAIDIPVEEPTRNQKFCDHCKTYFEYDKFIQHLYDLIYEKQKHKDKPKEAPKIQAPKTQTPAEEPANYYVCTVCTGHFRFLNNITIHCSKNHSMKFEPQEPVPFSYKCSMCPTPVTTTKYLNKHIREHHATLWEKSVGKVKKAKSSSATQNHSILKKYLSNTHGVKKFVGKQIVGSNVSQAARKVIVSKNAAAPSKKVKKSLARFIHDKYGFVSKNVLFKCDNCPIHFLNCLSGISHASHDHRKSDSLGWSKCDKCQRAFRPRDKQLHELQHRYVDKFKVFVIHDNIYARVLLKCPGCDIHFDERALIKHCKDAACGETVQAAACSVCRAVINNVPMHSLKHTEKNFLKTDFIWIEDYVTLPGNDVNPLKRKTQSEEEPAKRAKTSVNQSMNTTTSKEDIILYYCPNCKCFTRWHQDKQFHGSGQCLAMKRKPCSLCGLPFLKDRELNNHMKMHYRRSFELKDLSFAYLSNSKPMTPSVTEFPLCKECGIHFIDYRGHGCNKQTSKQCHICNKKFSEQAYDLHMLHHKYFQSSASNTKSNIEQSLKTIYEKLKPTWDILYKCTICDVMSDTYDSVVEHCQKHYNKMENYDVAIINCEICSMNFDDKSYERHRVVHGNQDIKSDRFTVLKYEYFQLLTDNWVKILDPLPEELRMQIQKQSIYVTREVRMLIKCNGPAGKTLYKCSTCDLIVPPLQVLEHTKNPSNCTGIGFKCSFCSLVFASSISKGKHEKYHNNCSDSLVSGHRIVTFNSPSDKEFNQTLFSNSTISSRSSSSGPKSKCNPLPAKGMFKNKPVKELSQSNSTLDIIPKVTNTMPEARGKEFIYYQCQQCTCCSTYGTAITHKCFEPKDIRTCDLCLYNFPFRSIYQHTTTHEKTSNLTRDNIQIIPFNNHTKKSTIYMCSCNLHFLSEDQIKAHFPECSPLKKVPAVKCSKCGYLFPADLLVTHLCQHHSKPGTEIEVVCAETYFKCGACDCHFKKRMALCNHQRVCDGKTDRHECHKCGLTFSALLISQHQLGCAGDTRTIHNIVVINATRAKLSTNQSFEEKNAEKSILSENDDTLDGTELGANLNSSLDTTLTRISIYSKRIINNAIFKCTNCNCHFNSTSSIAQHMENFINTGIVSCPEYTTPVMCSECKLYFNQRSLSRHMTWHLKYKISMENVLFYVLDKSNTRFLVLESSVDDTKPQDKSQDTIENPENKDTAPKDNPEVKEDIKIDDSATVNTGDYFSAVAKIKMMKKQNKSILYKCNKCNLCYLTHASLHFHYDQNHVIHYKPHLCRLCGLTFPLMTMGKHRAQHHKDKYYDNANLCVVTVGAAHSKRFLSVKPVTGTDVELNDKESQDSSVVVNEQEDSEIGDPNVNETIDEGGPPDETIAEDNVDVEEDMSPESEIDLTFKLKELQKSKSLLLFKCIKCDIYYMNHYTLATHAEINRHVLNFPPRPCNLCGLNFTSFSIERHKKLHHPNNTFPKDSIYVVLSNPKDYRDVLSIKTLADGDGVTEDSIVSQSSNSENVCVDQVLPTTSSAKPADTASTSQTKYSHKLYKCGLCNVYFLSQNSCYKHVLCHEPMDAREFIDCKFCNLPFRIASLSTHVKLHHAGEFELSKVLVEEYTAGENKKPKIDIYYAIDKVQSRLVSTTTEERHEPPAESVPIEQNKCDEKQNAEVTNENTAPETHAESIDDTAKDPIVSNQPLDSVDQSKICESEKHTDDIDEYAKKEKEITSIDTVSDVQTENNSNPIKDSVKTPDRIELDLVKTEKENDGYTFDSLDGKDKDITSEAKDSDSRPPIEGENIPSNSEEVLAHIKNEIESDKDSDAKPVLECSYCDETFSNKISKDFHESLDHLDGKRNCPICQESFNVSILNEMHLKVNGDFFKCCVCDDSLNLDLLLKHAKVHTQ